MAFGFRDGKDLDPRIGSWKVEHVTKKKGEKKVSVEIPLARCKEVCEKCDENEHDTCGWSKTDYSGTGLEDLYCPDAYKLNLRGDTFSEVH